MMERRLNRQRLISVPSYYVSPQPDIPATFELLNDDTKRLILKFVGNKSYVTYGGINKHCREVYINTKGMEKRTFVFGYASLSVIIDKIGRYERDEEFGWKLGEAVSKGVVLYNRSDVMVWALQEQKELALHFICNVAGEEGRIDILNKVWNDMNDEVTKESAFCYVDEYASRHGKLNVLKWVETKGISINSKEYYAREAARGGYLHILKWLKEEKDFFLYEELYGFAIQGGQLHVMKWLREQGCPWDTHTFLFAALKGNLDILQWLHDKRCPWSNDDDDDRLHEEDLEPEVVQWCHVNGYGDRLDSLPILLQHPH